MLYFDMGPNNLFRLLRQGAVDAYGMGRGVTVPVFHRYKSHHPIIMTHHRRSELVRSPFE